MALRGIEWVIFAFFLLIDKEFFFFPLFGKEGLGEIL